jgi:hypothetical protein
MESQMRWSRPILALGLALSITILAACSGAGAGPTTGAGPTSATTESSAAPSEVAAATAGPTSMLVTSINILPTPSFDPSMVAVACDDATLGTSASMSCKDLTSLAVRIAATMSKSAPTQVSVTKPADNPNAIQITFWVPSSEGSGLDAFTTTIDPAAGTFTFPTADTEAVFPTAS